MGTNPGYYIQDLLSQFEACTASAEEGERVDERELEPDEGGAAAEARLKADELANAHKAQRVGLERALQAEGAAAEATRQAETRAELEAMLSKTTRALHFRTTTH